LSRDLAPRYHNPLLKRGQAQVPALLIGGSDGKPSRGVCLELTILDQILGLEALPVSRLSAQPRSVAAPAKPRRPAPTPDPLFIVGAPPPGSSAIDAVANFEARDIYAIRLADGRYHTLPHDAWANPDAPVKLAQKRPDEWSVTDFARRARVLRRVRGTAERHFLFNDAIACLYKNRDANPQARALCEALAREHTAAWPAMASSVMASISADDPPIVTAFQFLATVLSEREAFDEAIEVCEGALNLKLEDGTKTGFPGRIDRIKRARDRSRRQSPRSAPAPGSGQ
jgi:hypothetical protein